MCQFNTIIDKNMGLIEFLKEKGCWDAFNHNMRTIPEDPSVILTYFTNDPEGVGIGGAFVWQNSPEGHDFWMNLSDEYNNLTKPTNDLQD